MELLPVLLLVILCLYSGTFVGAVDQRFQNCSVPISCGSHPISFPFYIEEDHNYCGYPGFHLSCDYNNKNPRPILKLSNDDYIVHNIFYQNKSLIVSNPVFSNPSTTCFPPLRKPSFPTSFFLTPNQSQVFLLQNCRNSSSDLLKYKIGCSNENDTNSVLALPGNDMNQVAKASEKCGTGSNAMDFPAMNYSGQNEGMKEVLSRGFLLSWVANDCTFCNSTGGKCGFDYPSYRFKCYCPDRPHRAHCDPPEKTGNHLAVKAGIATTVVGIGFLIVILYYLRRKSLIFFWKQQNQTQQNVEAFLRSYGPVQVKRYSYLNVKKMTNSFTVKLGQGGFGEVYKGKLDDGSLVAVKVLNQSKGDDGREFINEVATISKTSHVNVVTLLGFCFEGTKRALIYEFMPNGSLEKFIFRENITETSHRLNWETHYQISLDIAKGLEYLHSGCNTRILHFDIKPHNILLDADFMPKISDFGLAKICARKESVISMLDPRGTIGYIAPEVFSRNFGEVSHKSDVYSYGMMILEMVGGRRNINLRVDNTSEIYFPHWVYKRVELDEDLGLKRIRNEEDRGKARKMIIVSLWCIQIDPSIRPTMSKVIEMLEGSLDSLEVPPKPFVYSPSRSRSPADSSST